MRTPQSFRRVRRSTVKNQENDGVYSEDFRNAVIHRGTRVDDESAEEILKLKDSLKELKLDNKLLKKKAKGLQTDLEERTKDDDESGVGRKLKR